MENLSSRGIAQEWIRIFNDKDIDALAELYDKNAVYTKIPGTQMVGKEQIVDYLGKVFLLDGFFIIVKNVLEDGQWTVIEWVDKLGLCGCEFFQVLNGKIIVQKGYWDRENFRKMNL